MKPRITAEPSASQFSSFLLGSSMSTPDASNFGYAAEPTKPLLLRNFTGVRLTRVHKGTPVETW